MITRAFLSECLACGVALLLTSCNLIDVASNPPVTRMVIVRPVDIFTGEVVDAVPEFLGISKDYRLNLAPGQRVDVPLNWHTQLRSDGAMRIIWTSRLKAKERLFLAEAGYHLVEVPLAQATAIDRNDTIEIDLPPTTLRMPRNSAYQSKSERVSYRTEKLKK